MRSSQQVVKDADITYRQLDYWTRTGCVHARGDDAPGSGFWRVYDDDEYRVITLIARLTKAGVSLDVAATAARDAFVDEDSGTFETSIGRGLTVAGAIR